jgi:hypothetical protein
MIDKIAAVKKKDLKYLLKDLKMELSDLQDDLGDNIINQTSQTEADLVLAAIRDDNIEKGLETAVGFVFEGVICPENLEEQITEMFTYNIDIKLHKAAYSHKRALFGRARTCSSPPKHRATKTYRGGEFHLD